MDLLEKINEGRPDPWWVDSRPIYSIWSKDGGSTITVYTRRLPEEFCWEYVQIWTTHHTNQEIGGILFRNGQVVNTWGWPKNEEYNKEFYYGDSK